MRIRCFWRRTAGNAEVLPDLLKAGASLNGEMRLIARRTASDFRSRAPRYSTCDTLVKLGAPVDRTDARSRRS